MRSEAPRRATEVRSRRLCSKRKISSSRRDLPGGRGWIGGKNPARFTCPWAVTTPYRPADRNKRHTLSLLADSRFCYGPWSGSVPPRLCGPPVDSVSISRRIAQTLCPARQHHRRRQPTKSSGRSSVPHCPICIMKLSSLFRSVGSGSGSSDPRHPDPPMSFCPPRRDRSKSLCVPHAMPLIRVEKCNEDTIATIKQLTARRTSVAAYA